MNGAGCVLPSAGGGAGCVCGGGARAPASRVAVIKGRVEEQLLYFKPQTKVHSPMSRRHNVLGDHNSKKTWTFCAVQQHTMLHYATLCYKSILDFITLDSFFHLTTIRVALSGAHLIGKLITENGI